MELRDLNDEQRAMVTKQNRDIIERKEALERLQANSDFKKCFGDDYINSEIRRLTRMLSNVEPSKREVFVEQLMFWSNFDKHIRNSIGMAYQAIAEQQQAEAIWSMSQEEYEEILSQETV